MCIQFQIPTCKIRFQVNFFNTNSFKCFFNMIFFLISNRRQVYFNNKIFLWYVEIYDAFHNIIQ